MTPRDQNMYRFYRRYLTFVAMFLTAFVVFWVIKPSPKPASAQPVYQHELFGDVSVVDGRFGAVGDGVTDDTAAFNAAIAYVADTLGGGTIRVPKPAVSYLITGTLLWREHVDIVGVGSTGNRFDPVHIDHQPTSLNTDFITLETDPQSGRGYNYPGHMKNLRITGHETNSRYGISVLHPNANFENVHVTEFQYPMRLRSGIHCKLERVYLEGRNASGTGSVGLQLDNSGGFEGTTLSIVDSKIRRGDWAIEIDTDSYNRIFIDNVLIESTWKGCMQVHEGTSFICVNNLDVENVGREADGSSMFELGVTGEGNTDTWGFFTNCNINGHNSAGRDTRKVFEIGDGVWSFTNIYANSAEAGVFNTTVQTDLVQIRNCRARNRDMTLFGSIYDWTKVTQEGVGYATAVGGNYIRSATERVDLTGASTVLSYDAVQQLGIIPVGVQLSVVETVVDDGGNDTFDVAVTNGWPAATRTIISNVPAADATARNVSFPYSPETDDTFELTFTPDGGNFTAGEVEATLYYIYPWSTSPGITMDAWFDQVGIGAIEPERYTDSLLNIRTGSGNNLHVKDDAGNGVLIQAWNDAETGLRDMDFRAAEYHFVTGIVRYETLESINPSATTTQGSNSINDVVSEYDAIQDNEVATLPEARAGRICYVLNNDTNQDALLVWPASGDQIDESGLNTQVEIAPGGRAFFVAVNDTDWYTYRTSTTGVLSPVVDTSGSPDTVSADLSASGRISIDLADAAENVTLTLNMRAAHDGISGVIHIKQDTTARDITWVAGTNLTNGVWMETEPTWSSMTASSDILVRYDVIGGDVYLTPTSEEQSTF